MSVFIFCCEFKFGLEGIVKIVDIIKVLFDQIALSHLLNRIRLYTNSPKSLVL